MPTAFYTRNDAEGDNIVYPQWFRQWHIHFAHIYTIFSDIFQVSLSKLASCSNTQVTFPFN